MLRIKSARQLNTTAPSITHVQDVTDDLHDIALHTLPFKQKVITLRVVSGRTFALTSSEFSPRGLLVLATDNRIVTGVSATPAIGNSLEVTITYTGASNANLTMLLIGDIQNG